MITISGEKCINCGACGEICPTHHIISRDGSPVIRESLRCLKCMHCAAVCPRQAIHFEEVPAYEEYPYEPEDDTLKLIMTRRSNRNFRDETPPEEDIAWALDMAQWCPSAKNIRQTRWLVLRGREKCDRLYNRVIDGCRETGVMPELVAQRDRGHRDSVTCGCSVVIFALSPDANPFGDTDAVIAATTLELLLRKCDIGSCWGGYLTRLAEKLPGVTAELGVPEGYHIACTLLCGYPDEPYRNIPWRPHADVIWK